jgi:Ribosomal protein L7/L12 C-terminal domain
VWWYGWVWGGISFGIPALVLVVIVLFWVALTQGRSQTRMERRLRDLEVRFEKLLLHVGFVADPSPPIADEVRVLARAPGAKIAAIRAYRQQTGAGLKEAKEAVERMIESGVWGIFNEG